MTSFTFTIEDLKSAPADVRRWLLGRIESDLLTLGSLPPNSPPVHALALAACTADEAARIFESIKDDFAATHVFLELARETGNDPAAQFHPINVDTLTRNTRLDGRLLVSCLRTINCAFQELRDDPRATLFGFDQANHVYVHETTYRSIRDLWLTLVRLHTPAEANSAEPVDWPPDFQPRQLGPSEDVATHRQH